MGHLLRYRLKSPGYWENGAIRTAAYVALAALATPEDGEMIFDAFVNRKDPEEKKSAPKHYPIPCKANG